VAAVLIAVEGGDTLQVGTANLPAPLCQSKGKNDV